MIGLYSSKSQCHKKWWKHKIKRDKKHKSNAVFERLLIQAIQNNSYNIYLGTFG